MNTHFPRLRPWYLLSLSALLVACSAQPIKEPKAASNHTANIQPVGARRIQVDTLLGKLAVYDIGSPASRTAPVLVLWPSVLADHRMYAPMLAQLKSQARVVLIDGPGHGASQDFPGASFSMRDCAVALKSILDSLGIDKVSVGGTSWGGLVGAEFALAYPQMTHSVIMLNSPIFSEPGMGDQMIVWLTRWMGNTEFFARQVAQGFFLKSTQEANHGVMDSFMTHLAQANKVALARAVEQVLVKREAVAPRLSQIQAPVLFVLGRQDDMYPLERLQQAAQGIKNLRLAIVDSKHISVADQPLAVAQLIDEVLAKQ